MKAYLGLCAGVLASLMYWYGHVQYDNGYRMGHINCTANHINQTLDRMLQDVSSWDQEAE